MRSQNIWEWSVNIADDHPIAGLVLSAVLIAVCIMLAFAA